MSDLWNIVFHIAHTFYYIGFYRRYAHHVLQTDLCNIYPHSICTVSSIYGHYDSCAFFTHDLEVEYMFWCILHKLHISFHTYDQFFHRDDLQYAQPIFCIIYLCSLHYIFMSTRGMFHMSKTSLNLLLIASVFIQSLLLLLQVFSEGLVFILFSQFYPFFLLQQISIQLFVLYSFP